MLTAAFNIFVDHFLQTIHLEIKQFGLLNGIVRGMNTNAGIIAEPLDQKAESAVANINVLVKLTITSEQNKIDRP